MLQGFPITVVCGGQQVLETGNLNIKYHQGKNKSLQHKIKPTDPSSVFRSFGAQNSHPGEIDPYGFLCLKILQSGEFKGPKNI